MTGVKIINPDLYLEVDGQRVWTPDLNKIAWEKCFRALEDQCRQFGPDLLVILVCGVQGSGKSTWIKNNATSYAPCVCFDAALPRPHHRQPIVETAKRSGCTIKAVYIDVPLDVALSRNMLRREDERVAEEAIKNVFRQFEAPSYAEGFDEVIHVHGLV